MEAFNTAGGQPQNAQQTTPRQREVGTGRAATVPNVRTGNRRRESDQRVIDEAQAVRYRSSQDVDLTPDQTGDFEDDLLLDDGLGPRGYLQHSRTERVTTETCFGVNHFAHPNSPLLLLREIISQAKRRPQELRIFLTPPRHISLMMIPHAVSRNKRCLWKEKAKLLEFRTFTEERCSFEIQRGIRSCNCAYGLHR